MPSVPRSASGPVMRPSAPCGDITRTSPTTAAPTDGVRAAAGSRSAAPPAMPNRPPSDEQAAELVDQLAMLAEAHGLPGAQSEPEHDVGRADRDREQQQRLERLGGGPVVPQRPVAAEHATAEVAEELAEQDAEDDRPAPHPSAGSGSTPASAGVRAAAERRARNASASSTTP